MANDLMSFDFGNLPSTSVIEVEAYDNLSKGGDFVRRIQLVGKGNYVDNQKIAPGHYGIPIDVNTIIDLGKSIDVRVLAHRPKALDMRDKPVHACFNPADPDFIEIDRLAGIKNSKCQSGIEFLLFEPSQQEFFTFFFGPPTWHPESKIMLGLAPISQASIDVLKSMKKPVDKLVPHGPLAATMTARYVKGAQFSWFVPVINPCSLEIPVDEKLAIEQIKKFKAPPAQATEGDQKQEASTARAR